MDGQSKNHCIQVTYWLVPQTDISSLLLDFQVWVRLRSHDLLCSGNQHSGYSCCCKHWTSDLYHVYASAKRKETNLYTLKRQSQQKSSAFVVCWNVLEASPTNSVDPDQTAPLGAVRSGSILFVSLLYLVKCKQKFAADNNCRQNFRCFFCFFLHFKG